MTKSTTSRPDPDPDGLDALTARLRREDGRWRRRILWLSLLPLAVGVAVIVLAWQGVERAQARKSLLEHEQAALNGEIDRQREQIQDLQATRVALDREIAARQELLDEATRMLPTRERDSIQTVQQGLIQAKSGKLDEALQSYEQALERDQRNAVAHRLRGQALYDEGRYDDAAASLQRALELNPDDAEARYALALVLWARGQADQAGAQIERAFQDPQVQARAMQDPHFKPIRIHLDDRAAQASGRSEVERRWIDAGLSAARTGDFASAVQAYRRALEANPSNWRVWNWHGYALLRLGRADEAAASLERAVKLAPREPEPHYNLALAHWDAGRTAQAQASLRAAYEADPAYRAIAGRDLQSKALRASLPR